jgi:hypothetical protein
VYGRVSVYVRDMVATWSAYACMHTYTCITYNIHTYTHLHTPNAGQKVARSLAEYSAPTEEIKDPKALRARCDKALII